jgi:hypothetical protein
VGCTESPFACEQDLAISENFFQNSAFESDEYILELKATNGQDSTGISSNNLMNSFSIKSSGTTQLTFYMNKAPINGICSLILNGTDQLRYFRYSF